MNVILNESSVIAICRITPDGGVDLVLHKGGKTTVVQCKHWRDTQVSVQPVRELFGVMHASGAHAAIFVSTGAYTSDAVEFAQELPIRLIDGDELARMVVAIQEERWTDSRLTDQSVGAIPAASGIRESVPYLR